MLVASLIMVAACSGSGRSSTPATHRIGDTVTVNDGTEAVTVTVHSFANGVANVEQCSGVTTPSWWRAEMKDKSIVDVRFGKVTDELPSKPLAPGECARGNVNLDVLTEDIVAVAYAPPGEPVISFLVAR